MSCCRVPYNKKPVRSEPATICPACNNKAKRVERITVKHILKGEHQGEIKEAQYYFCETPGCDMVYFSPETEQRFTKASARVRVGIKEAEGPITLCYCFDFTDQMMQAEILATKRTSMLDVIAAEIEAGHCACEVKNPSGRCCLGEVSKYIKRLQTHLKLSTR